MDGSLILPELDERRSGLLLGIDTGGTFTDAVLTDEAGNVAFKAKALTTRHDLAEGIGFAAGRVLAEAAAAELGDVAAVAERIRLVSVSTTLATNAVVEGYGQPIGLILIGQGEEALTRAGLREALGDDPVAFVAGGHDSRGDLKSDLDEAAVQEAARRAAGRVSAFAVSSLFATRNPGHETRAREILRGATGLPVTCGHELSASLDMPRRALTAVLNARLIPLVTDLVAAVQAMLQERGIDAPLMVVKGDGSLISAETALLKPVETILSGPAASVIGARHLTGEDTMIVADMGGTTTDIALLRGGHPVLNVNGASVGGWRTMVEAIAVHTVGLGGDSEVRLDGDRRLVCGPRRAVPLSLLATQSKRVIPALQRQIATAERKPTDGRFALRQRALDPAAGRLSGAEQRLWDRLEDGPLDLETLFADRTPEQPLRRLVDRGLVAISAFTPSDAAHVLGLHEAWDARAAKLGAALWARRDRPGRRLCETGEQFARRVFDQVVRQAGEAVLAALLDEEGVPGNGALAAPLARRLLDGAFAERTPDAEDRPRLFDAALAFRLPIAGIGAPAATYYPALAERTRGVLRLPEHGEVSNAVGAVAGGVTQTMTILISQPAEGLFRVHLPGGPADYAEIERAIARAEEAARREAGAMATRAGADDVKVQARRDERVVRQPDGTSVFIEAIVTATATGRPRLGCVRAHPCMGK